METLKKINARKAVRKYSGQITDEQLHQILLAGNAGPVGLGQYENYQITVIQDAKVLSKLNGIYDAPTVIVVSSNKSSGMEHISAGAIVHNMELAAEDQGLGANYNMASLNSILQDILPAGFSPLFALTLGQTDDKFTARDVPIDRIKTNIVK